MNRQAVAEQAHIYRLEGLGCADCAARFEEDVRHLRGVKEARLDFGSARLLVHGTHDRQAIQRLARMHELAVSPDGVPPEAAASGLHPREIGIVISLVALLLAWIGSAMLPESPDGIGSEGLIASVAGYHPAVAILLLTAMATGGLTTFRRGLRALARLRFDMNSLMTIAVTGALILGEWWEAATVAVLYGIGETLEARTIERARQSLRALLNLSPRHATVIRDGTERDVPVDEVRVGDHVLVRPGQRIPVDGTVIAGSSSVDQSPVTGESMPVDKQPGSPVFSGTVNRHGALTIKAERKAADSTLARIIHLVEEAQGSRAPSQKFIDRFAAVYTPAVLVVALIVGLIPPLLLGHPWNPWIYRALTLLVVACPCALVVSTPVALVSAIGAAARRGILIKGGAHLEELGKVRVVAFDKTGTMTSGRLDIVDLWTNAHAPDLRDASRAPGLRPGDDPPEPERALLTLAASIEAPSEHPLARAVVSGAKRKDIPLRPITDFVAIPGVGARARIDGETYWLGNRRLWQMGPQQTTSDAVAEGFAHETVTARGEQPGRAGYDALEPVIARWQSNGWAVMILASRRGIIGAMALADELRPEARQALQRLKAAGVERTVLLSGDHRPAVASIARAAGIDEYRADLLPQDKVDEVRKLTAAHGHVAMVGDGINDAPALAAASVGIAMGAAGTDAALETADVVLMNDDLRRVADAMGLSRRTLRIIQQNIGFSLAVKGIALLLIGPGWLTLWLAILADMGATIIVSLNGARLLFNTTPAEGEATCE